MLKGFKLVALSTLSVFFLLPAVTCAAEVLETPEEIVVTGRLPGPPLWRVNNGDRVLWIFPYLSPIPEDMDWQSDRVARVIAASQAAISMPRMESSTSPLLLLNPFNIVRGLRLARRISRNPDGGTLEANLSPELYARFAALQAQYFPRNDDLDDMRPLLAGARLSSIIEDEEGLVNDTDILKTIRRLIRRNRDIEYTEVVVNMELEGSFRELADRAETLMQSLSPEQEQLCFEQNVRHMEEDIDEMKSRANAWAQGYVDEFRNIPLVFDESNACIDLILGSSEQELLLDLTDRMNRMWLDAAEKALATHASTFAVLPINELLVEDGLLSMLRARGYAIREP